MEYAFEATEEVTQEHVEFFETHGFLVLKHALHPKKIAELNGAIEQLKEEFRHSERRRGDFGLNVRPVVDRSDSFLELLEWPVTFPKAVRFLEHFNIQLSTSHLIIVPPNPEVRSIGWHPDGGKPGIGMYGRRALGSLKIGYFLSDLPQENMGALMVVPGSNRSDGGPSFLAGRSEPMGALELTVEAGDAVIFGQSTWHASAPNYSDQDRVVLYFGYCYRVLRPMDYDQMPESLLAKCSPIGKQLLGHRASHMGYYVPTEEDVPLKAWYQERFGETWQDL